MQQGELVVSGKAKIALALHHKPKQVIVYFKDGCHIVPCNPHHFDSLHWEIEEKNVNHGHHNFRKEYFLVIHWHVNSIREIYWTVY